MNKVIENIKERRSIRIFKTDPVSEDDLNVIIEAGSYAPSQGNKQTWHFTIIKSPSMINEMIEAARIWTSNSETPAFRERAKVIEYDLFYGSPVNIIVSGKDEDPYSKTDCAAAVQNMLLAAQSLGLASCWKNMVTGLLKSEYGSAIKLKLGMPAEFTPYFGLVLGYRTDVEIPVPSRKSDCFNII